MYKYTIDAYYGGGSYSSTEIIVEANSESSALKKAKTLIERDYYSVRKIDTTK